MSDVFLVRHEIAPGETEAVREFFAEIDANPGAVLDVLEAETVYTESAFLEQGDEADHILYYIEAADGATVYDVFQELVGDPESVGEGHAGFVETFESLVTGEPELVAVDRLYHLVNPARPTAN